MWLSDIFFDHNHHHTLSCEFSNPRAGSQLKSFPQKNVWKSDKSWEPEKILKFEIFLKFEKIWKSEI